MSWGLLGGEQVASDRRIRTLGLSPVIRAFNELAVPGLGGTWYGKQLVLALLGVDLANTQRSNGLRLSNITVANGVEALAVWSAFEQSNWAKNDRLPGLRKLGRRRGQNNPDFKLATSRSFYVTQPMRIRAGEPLASFGLVNATSSRFNSFTCAEIGNALLDASCKQARTSLLEWIAGGNLPYFYSATRNEINPLQPLSSASRDILRAAFLGGSVFARSRRASALSWVESLRQTSKGHTDWSICPPAISDASHWLDLRAGARFADVYNAAGAAPNDASVLQKVEGRLGMHARKKMPLAEAHSPDISSLIETLRQKAHIFLNEGHDPTPDQLATHFCNACVQTDEVSILRHLLVRDGRILRLVDDMIVPGPAFDGRSFTDAIAGREPPSGLSDEDASAEDAPIDNLPPLPAGISGRISNLFYLAADLGTYQSTLGGHQVE